MSLKRVQIERLVNLIETMGVTHFISGVDLGVERFVAEIVLGLKRDYPEIILECVIPYEDQAANWTIAQRNKYFSIMERCDKETLLQHRNSKDCIRKKKEYMVKKSNNVLVVGN
ncbi:SLOG family protein [Desulfosporosinus sp. FKB]|uniref:SLOG family protein n=1 Tax=Desulfosporosinus sp. FKB TaxID=1969835 RepID=UPI001124E9D4|nr:SLOG family protein [Desulfosporosinus sp. FKB]